MKKQKAKHLPNSNTRSNGIYYTALHNPFAYTAFIRWAKQHQIQREVILEPFAGANNLIDMLQELGHCKHYRSYDLYPQSLSVQSRDTLSDYPTGYRVCITNPPWLYKSSASRRGLPFPETEFDDLYKHCLSLCLKYSSYVAALIPASFLQSKLFRQRLEKIIFIHKKLFSYTDNPVCLALFQEEMVKDTQIYLDNKLIGMLGKLESYLPNSKTASSRSIQFNAIKGPLGFISIDNNSSPSIRFCHGATLRHHAIKISSRAITRIDGIDVTDSLIDHLNERIDMIRASTYDVFLTAFKGLRKDGKYRRRMEYRLARDIIADCL